MDASFFIARRLRFKGKVVMVSVAVSFFIMILAVSVSSGFRSEIRSGLSAVSGDIRIIPPTMNFLDENSPVESDAAYMEHIRKIPGIGSIVPTAYRAGIVKKGENIHGILMKGLPAEALPIYNMDFPDTLTLPVSIPSRLAEITGLEVGDKMLTYFVGENVKARQFNVASVYDALVEADDKLVVYSYLSDIQRINGWEENQVSALELMLNDSGKDNMERKCTEVGVTINAFSSDEDEPVIAVSSSSMYPQMFDWLDLIDFNVLFILVLMTIVAGFNMISGLLIMLFENISTIGLLKSLGMTDKSIAKVFLSSSAVLVLKGMALGNALAISFCMIQDATHILKLNPENYFVSHVPVDIDFAMIFAADLVAFAVIMILLLIPCLFVAKVDPAETVRVK